MHEFDREHATLLAGAMRSALDGGRWTTDRYCEGRLAGLERTLSLPPRTDDADLAQMDAGILHVQASDFMVLAQGAYLDGSLSSPTPADDRLFSPHRASMPPLAAPVGAEIVEMTFGGRGRPTALAA